MTDVIVGPHDPVLMSGGSLGIWIECECGWIAPGGYTEERVYAQHARHVEACRNMKEQN